jgi:PX domain
MPNYGMPPVGIWRRYSEFELLRNYLEITYPAIVVPPLPEKRVSMSRSINKLQQLIVSHMSVIMLPRLHLVLLIFN